MLKENGTCGERPVLLPAAVRKSSNTTKDARMLPLNEETGEANKSLKLFVCFALLFFTVSSTLCAQASKSSDETYAYNTFVIPFVTETLKCIISIVFELSSTAVDSKGSDFNAQRFLRFSIPAACYFVSNNCMFYIIRELGGVTFQVTNNLKILSTGLMMRLFLGRKLKWLQWKALVVLAIGCAVTQLKTCAGDHFGDVGDRSFSKYSLGYTMVLLNAMASATGGVVSERLLKGSHQETGESIHRQNAQLYFFGAVFGLIAIRHDASNIRNTTETLNDTTLMLKGFNVFACATILSLTATGLLVSFVFKYMDNFVKCFVAAVSMLCVALFDAWARDEKPSLQLFFGITLTCLAVEQYYFS